MPSTQVPRGSRLPAFRDEAWDKRGAGWFSPSVAACWTARGGARKWCPAVPKSPPASISCRAAQTARRAATGNQTAVLLYCLPSCHDCRDAENRLKRDTPSKPRPRRGTNGQKPTRRAVRFGTNLRLEPNCFVDRLSFPGTGTRLWGLAQTYAASWKPGCARARPTVSGCHRVPRELAASTTGSAESSPGGSARQQLHSTVFTRARRMRHFNAGTAPGLHMPITVAPEHREIPRVASGSRPALNGQVTLDAIAPLEFSSYGAVPGFREREVTASVRS